MLDSIELSMRVQKCLIKLEPLPLQGLEKKFVFGLWNDFPQTLAVCQLTGLLMILFKSVATLSYSSILNWLKFLIYIYGFFLNFLNWYLLPSLLTFVA